MAPKPQRSESPAKPGVLDPHPREARTREGQGEDAVDEDPRQGKDPAPPACCTTEGGGGGCARVAGPGGFCYRARVVGARDALRGAGKAVRIRRDPVTVIGDETRGGHWSEGREGAGSRTIREPGDLPGRSPHRSSREGREVMVSSLFVLGGARSGKSRFAVASQRAHARVTFLATAQAGDGDMAARIARHRAERPEHWTTIEEPFDLVQRLRPLTGDAVIVDCLTMWVANRMLRGDSADAILADADALAALIRRPSPALTDRLQRGRRRRAPGDRRRPALSRSPRDGQPAGRGRGRARRPDGGRHPSRGEDTSPCLSHLDSPDWLAPSPRRTNRRARRSSAISTASPSPRAAWDVWRRSPGGWPWYAAARRASRGR